jgi:hypothetical protein
VFFNDFIKDDFIPEGDGQVASGFASLSDLSDPVALETEEQTLEIEQNERDVLEPLGDCKCDAGMSVENVTAVVSHKKPCTTLDLTHIRHSRLYNLVAWTIHILNGNKSHKKNSHGTIFAHKFSTWLSVGVVKSVEKEKSVAGQCIQV